MNREILFKAKRKDNNEWVYGYLIIDNKNLYVNAKEDVYYIASNTDMYVEVIPETICEYTGLKDKNGVEIYENDIVKYDSGFGGYETSTIFYDEYRLSLNFRTDFGYNYSGIWELRNQKNIEVIGNIFDCEV